MGSFLEQEYVVLGERAWNWRRWLSFFWVRVSSIRGPPGLYFTSFDKRVGELLSFGGELVAN